MTVRVGDTVRRPRSDRSSWVEGLLVHLDEVGADVAPRFLGVDDRGRQVLEYVEGETVPGPPYHLGDERIVDSMRLLRRFHDATAGTAWAGPADVVCHRDLGPHNTVYRGTQAVRIIDWDDDVSPGRRVEDVADAVWGFCDLVDDHAAVAEQARRLALACEAYGGVTPEETVVELSGYFSRSLENHRAAGRDGAVQVFRQLLGWTEQHHDALTRPRPATRSTGRSAPSR